MAESAKAHAQSVVAPAYFALYTLRSFRSYIARLFPFPPANDGLDLNHLSYPSNCASLIFYTSASTVHLIPSQHGGVVKEPG